MYDASLFATNYTIIIIAIVAVNTANQFFPKYFIMEKYLGDKFGSLIKL